MSDSSFKSWFTNRVQMPDGETYAGDMLEFTGIVDLFASEYGLGGCRSLEEYAEMIDKCDPLLIACLQKNIEERYKAQYSTEELDNESKDYSIKGYENKKAEKVVREKMIDTDNEKSNRMRMAHFLKQMGANKKEVNEAIKKIENGEIKFSGRDYSWITSKELRKPDFDLKSVMRQMREDREKGMNFKVSLDTMAGVS